jgi:hypothetical protein
VDLFLNHASQILEAAESAVTNGGVCSEMTILVGQDGAIQMFTDSDWPLESLTRHHGARAGYRVSGRHGTVRVEGQGQQRTCQLHSTSPAAVRRQLLGPR